jgi:hypothetical protein
MVIGLDRHQLHSGIAEPKPRAHFSELMLEWKYIEAHSAFAKRLNE